MNGTTVTPEGARSLVLEAHEALRGHDLERAQACLEQAARSWGRLGSSEQQRWCAQAATSLARYRTRREAAGLSPADDHSLAEQVAVDQQAGMRLLEATGQLVTGDREAARQSLRDARQHALGQGDVIGYLAVMVAQAQLAVADGDRAGAYRSLATGWATLSDAIGSAAAERMVAPQLGDLRAAWGAEAFAEARAGYEAEMRERRRRDSSRQEGGSNG